VSAPAGAPSRRSWPQRLLIAANAFALVAALSTAGALAFGNSRLARLDRLDLSNDLRADELEPGDPQNYLVVGIDDASGLPEGDPVRNREVVAGQLSDTIMVVRVEPDTGAARVLSIPRDLWVPIADTDYEQKINSAMATGGAARLVRTIEQNFGIPIHHFVQVDLAGFRELVDVVGGVPVYFPRPARAASTGLDIPAAGCYVLGPRQALAFVRPRKDYRVQDADGTWHVDPGGDFSRQGRQQLFIQLSLRQAISKGARNPNTLRRLVDLGIESVRVDDAWSPDVALALAGPFREFDPSELERYQLTVTDDWAGSQSILRLQEDASEPVLALFRGEGVAPDSLDPAEVTLQVLNGTGTRGQGGDATDAFIAAGFEALVSTDASELGGVTTVRYPAGLEAGARLVATWIAGPVVYEETTVSGGADIVVVTGSDWQGVASSARDADDVPAPTTTTEPADTDDDQTTATDGSTDDTTTTTEAEAEADPDDADDPDDPAFFLARAPESGEECTPTE